MDSAIALSREPKTAPRHGLLVVKSNADLEAEDQARREAEQAQNQPIITSLATVIRKAWEEAQFARTAIENRMIDGLRRRNGEYSPDKLMAIRAQGGSEIYMMLTSIKCRAAKSWITDILFPPGQQPFKVEPTPMPDLDPGTEAEIAEFVQAEAQLFMAQAQQMLPPEALQERMKQVKDDLEKYRKEKANEVAARMQTKIEDQVEEGGWEQALREVIDDVTTYPLSILKGPIVRKRRALKWEESGDGSWKPVKGESYRLEWSRSSPFDIYPSPSSRTLQDGSLIERHRLRRSDLAAMKGVPGYNDAAIDMVLTEYGTGGLRQWLWRDQERNRLENRPHEYMNHGETIDALQFWGSASGKILVDWGMDPEQVPDLNAEYSVEAWLIGHYVIRAVLNDHPLGERPYHGASFEEIAGSLWGKGIPELMADLQDMCNAAARSLVNNMAIASGPQAEIHTDRLAVGEEITGMEPWRVWQTLSDPHGTNNPAVRFFSVPSNAEVLIKVYEYFSNLADEYTGIPKYSYGDSSNGPTDNASALSMLMTSASRGIKLVIGHLDKPIEGSIKGAYIHNMLYDEDPSIKGDLIPKAIGSKSLIAKEQQTIRRNEILQTTNNPTDNAIIGMPGRAELLRQTFNSLELPDIVPDKEELELNMRQAMAAALPGGGQPGAPQSVDAAGNPVSGQDTALFQQ